jgi:hypothetical protein
MTLKMSDLGCKQTLVDASAIWNATNLKLRLFQSNTTPTTSSVIGDFTECTFAGYAAVSLTGWATPIVAAHDATMLADLKTFTRTSTGASQNIYGYYVTDNATTFLLWAERDPLAPIVVTNNGDSYTVTPSLSEQDLST